MGYAPPPTESDAKRIPDSSSSTCMVFSRRIPPAKSLGLAPPPIEGYANSIPNLHKSHRGLPGGKVYTVTRFVLLSALVSIAILGVLELATDIYPDHRRLPENEKVTHLEEGNYLDDCFTLATLRPISEGNVKDLEETINNQPPTGQHQDDEKCDYAPRPYIQSVLDSAMIATTLSFAMSGGEAAARFQGDDALSSIHKAHESLFEPEVGVLVRGSIRGSERMVQPPEGHQQRPEWLL